MSQTFRVAGMTCDGCVSAVKRAIDRQAPGARVTVDLDSGKVSVDGAADRNAVAAAIEAAGFQIVAPTG